MFVLLTYETREKRHFDKVLIYNPDVPQNAISAASILAICFADRPP